MKSARTAALALGVGGFILAFLYTGVRNLLLGLAVSLALNLAIILASIGVCCFIWKPNNNPDAVRGRNGCANFLVGLAVGIGLCFLKIFI